MQTRLTLAALALLAGCGDTFFLGTDSSGRLEVIISSSGDGANGGGFSITVDGGASQFYSGGDHVTLTGLTAGRHSVKLGGLSENCTVLGANPRTVEVGGDGKAAVTFDLYCTRPTTGALEITVVTRGEPADTDGYLLAVGEGGTRSIASNAVELFRGMPEGEHLVMLKNMSPGCVLDGGNPQGAVVEIGKTHPVTLAVTCGGERR
ncbi:MAG TPA: hypothetical protein VF046_15220 [Gemmatimonadales bacterium]